MGSTCSVYLLNQKLLSAMAKAMKAMKVMKKKAAMKVIKKKAVGAMPAGAVTVAVAEKTGLKTKEVKSVLSSLGAIGAVEVKKTGKFTIPGLAMLKLKHKAATPAGTRSMFGKVVKVKAMKASKRVKAFAVKAFKDAATN